MRGSSIRRLSTAVAALLAAAGLAGCGLGAGPTPKGATLLITREFGSQPVLSRSSPKVKGSSTVMQLLTRNAKVATKYSGGFVQSIDGHSGDDSGGEPRDWFYYINGLEAERGAASVEVHEGDHIWWDLHDWGETDHIPAIVGSFPQPFLDGLQGKKFPVKIGCKEPHSGPCHLVTQRLTALEVPSAFAAIGPTLEAPQTLALLVGTWSQLKASPAVQLLEKGPAQSGVYARVLRGGKAIAPLSSDGETRGSLGPGAGLIAATRYAGEGPVWIVMGTDGQGVLRAAKDFDAATLDGHFAVAIPPSGKPIPLPQTSG